MIGTLVSVIIAAVLWFHPYTADIGTNWDGLKTFLIAVSVGFIFLVPIGIMLAWSSLQKAGQYSTPKIMDLFSSDLHIKLAQGYLIAFVFVCLILIPVVEKELIGTKWGFPLWVIAFGLAIDATTHFVNRILGFLNPYVVVKLFSKRAEKCIENDKELDLCDWIDGITEIALKGINRHSTSLSHDALSEEQIIIRNFLAVSKNIGHAQQDAQTKAVGIKDKVSYVLFHFYQRIDVIFERALENSLEMTTSHIIRLMGKVVLDAAKYDITMATVPLRFLGKFARKAQEKGFEESTMTASCVLSEVARELLTDIDITYAEIQDPFLSIINGLEVISKGAFQRDKSIKISILEEPFKELKELFEQGKAKDHQDTPVIMQNINRILGEFQALQLVMLTRPPIPTVTEDLLPGKE